MMYKKVDEVAVENKVVLVRVDYNCPLDDEGNILDDARIQASLKTIRYLLDQNAKVVIISHNGRPKGERVPRLTMEKVAVRLGELLGQKIEYLPECTGQKVKDFVANMQPKDVVVLENLRFNSAEKSKDEFERDAFGKELASLADMYVNEAFACSHRKQASITSVPKFLPSVAGINLDDEYMKIKKYMEHPEKPFVAIIGGAKADKLPFVRLLLESADHILVGGIIANTFLKAHGSDIGASKVHEDMLEEAKELIANPKVHIPVDAITSDSLDGEPEIHSLEDIPADHLILGLGPKTIEQYVNIIAEAKTIVWAGAVDVYEKDQFIQGTKALAEAITAPGKVSILGGGDASASVRKVGYIDKVTLSATGGGASLTLFEEGDLVGVKVLT